jgi:uncharacterized membrane protein HdeD (DUF308 family)
MKFEELQMIWNIQTRQPLYAINEIALHAELLRQRQKLRRTWFRWMIAPAYLAAGTLGLLIGSLLLFFVFKASTSITGADAAMLSVSGGAMLYFMTTIVRYRRLERRREAASGGSLREELERGIANLDYQIRSGGGSSANWMALPLVLSVLLTLVVISDLMSAPLLFPVLVGGVMLLSFPVELWRHRRRVTRDLLPRKRTLESLLSRLNGPPQLV